MNNSLEGAFRCEQLLLVEGKNSGAPVLSDETRVSSGIGRSSAIRHGSLKQAIRGFTIALDELLLPSSV